MYMMQKGKSQKEKGSYDTMSWVESYNLHRFNWLRRSGKLYLRLYIQMSHRAKLEEEAEQSESERSYFLM